MANSPICVELSSGPDSDDSDVEIINDTQTIKPLPQTDDDDKVEPKLRMLGEVKFRQCTISKVKNDPDPDGIKIVNVMSLVSNEASGLSSSTKKTEHEELGPEIDDNCVVNPKSKITVQTEGTNADVSGKISSLLKNRLIANPERSFTVRTEVKINTSSSNVLSTTTSFNDSKIETCSTVKADSQEWNVSPQVTTFKTRIINTDSKELSLSLSKQAHLSSKKYAKLIQLGPVVPAKDTKSENDPTPSVNTKPVISMKSHDGSISLVKEKKERNIEEEKTTTDSVQVNDASSDSDLEEIQTTQGPDPDPETTVIKDSDDSQSSEVECSTNESLNPDEDIAKMKTIVLKSGFGKEGRQVVKRIAKHYETIRGDIIEDLNSVKELNSLVKQAQIDLNSKKSTLEMAKTVKKVIGFLKTRISKESKDEAKLKYLYKLYDKVSARIKILETKDVESDSDESNNTYVILSKYRTKAVQVYKEICKTEKISHTAGRRYLHKFNYIGKGPVVVQKALEKYFNKTRKFPNFSETLKLIYKVNSTENLGMTTIETRTLAESIFVDFGQKLQQIRIEDDRLLFKDYLTLAANDPALEDAELARKLEENKRLRKKEEDVLDYYVQKQLGRGTESAKEGTGDENEVGSDDCDTDDDRGSEQGDSDGEDHGRGVIDIESGDSSDANEDDPVSKKVKR